MTLTPWTREPKGPDYVYMARASGAGGISIYDPTFTWPDSGYVDAPDWDDWHPITSDDQPGEGPGLWGFPDGGHHPAVWRGPIEVWHLATFQIFVVKRQELWWDRSTKLPGAPLGWGSARTPRAWVKYSGSLFSVCRSLRAENDVYATSVSIRMLAGANRYGLYAVASLAELFTIPAERRTA